MNNFLKVGMLWIIALLFYPIGFQMVLTNNPILIFLSLTISILFIIVMCIYVRKGIKRNNYEND